MSEQQMDQGALGELVEGKSDDEINEAVNQMGGSDALLTQVFQGFKDRFQADKAAGQSAVIQWDITTPDGVKTTQLHVKDGNLDVVPGGTEAARVTLQLAQPDFIRFIAGKLDGMQAFMTGKLKLQGDMMFAQTMQAWFAA